MKHKEKLMLALIKTHGRNYFMATVDKYSGNRYKVVACETCPQLIGNEYRFGHGIVRRYYKNLEEN